MRVTIFYLDGPNMAYDNELEDRLGFGPSTDAGTLLIGPTVRDISWANIPEDSNRFKIEEVAQEVCKNDLVKITYEVTETWWAPEWRDK